MDITEQVPEAVRDWLHRKMAMATTADNRTATTMLTNAVLAGMIRPEELAELNATKSGQLTTKESEMETSTTTTTSPSRSEVFGSVRVKAVLDDSSLGGLEIAPVVIDQNIVTFPLLSGQLYPFVDVVHIPRGRRCRGRVGNGGLRKPLLRRRAAIPHGSERLLCVE